MEIYYNWKTKLFSPKFEIYRHESLKGELCKEIWPRKVNGELNARRIMFETKGVFRHQTKIIDLQGGMDMGRIIFSLRKSGTYVIYRNKKYYWQFDNFLRSRWSLNDENENIIKYHSNAFTGLIVSYTTDEILILAGFFIRNFIKQRLAVLA
jgi:hypothetical protein